ncbi:oligopeptide/dipeptide ABC transporter, ATP-binding protein, C-terminal domain [Anaerolinea thermolimosa]|uniref:ABC transporter ATP-binding protein n=1 Tax=Anaerolinea thermolimosa TaxID=229919 RepID=UPI0007863030|nr:ABC transporter ATP-binding protein [Anaerolinea thermolimosa]GAP07692.1 oligopeptide/dipeptide ABC transporter, ATP-binding protein, C-terminal domain [Anaerolinea thermolimosa]
MGKIMLEVNELTTKYITRFGENVYAVDHVSLKVEEGKSLGIAGESGCGKSTLALSLMGYYFAPLHYTSGEIIIDGQKITGMDPDDIRRKILGKEIAYIPQAAMNALNPTLKIIHFIEDVIHAHDPKATKKEIYELARERFAILGLPEEVLQKYPVELSGGMKQRTVIATSVILSPKVLIADEPSSALDVTSQKMVIKMLKDLMEKGFVKAMIFITHELPLLYNVTDDIMVMYAGQIVEKGTAREVVFDPLHPYSKGLMGAIIVPESGVRNVKLTAIPGTPPNLKNPPSGCRFADRCKYVQPECKVRSIDFRDVGNGRAYRCIFSEEQLRKAYQNG